MYVGLKSENTVVIILLKGFRNEGYKKYLESILNKPNVKKCHIFIEKGVNIGYIRVFTRYTLLEITDIDVYIHCKDKFMRKTLKSYFENLNNITVMNINKPIYFRIAKNYYRKIVVGNRCGIAISDVRNKED